MNELNGRSAGMNRRRVIQAVLLLLAAALTVPSPEGHAQIPAQSVRLAPNQRIRITVPRFGPKSFESTIVAINGDSLVLQSRPSYAEVAVRRNEITAMEVVVGRGRQWRRGAELGASVGATAGLLVGVFSGAFRDDGSFGCGDGDCTGGQLARRGLRGALWGGGVGLLAGLVAGGLSKGPTWRPVAGLPLSIGLSSGSAGTALVGRLDRFVEAESPRTAAIRVNSPNDPPSAGWRSARPGIRLLPPLGSVTRPTVAESGR